MSDGVQAIGVYRWPYSEPDVAELCDLLYGERSPDNLKEARSQLDGLAVVELRVESPEAVDLSELSQAPPAERDGSEQAPYDEQWWSADGETCFGPTMPSDGGPGRVVFFLHFFETGKPLHWGNKRRIELPGMVDLPSRLAESMTYDAP
jgi:hypothetical protein